CRIITTPQVATFTISGQVLDGNQQPLSNVTITLTGGSTPVTTSTANTGTYAFNNWAQGGNYTVTPSLGGFTFNPASQTFNNLSSNQTANFAATPVTPGTFSISGP